MKLCILSKQHFRNLHVSQDTIKAFEYAFSQNAKISTEIVKISQMTNKVNRRIIRYAAKWDFLKKVQLIDYRTIGQVCKINPDVVMVIAMSPGDLNAYIPVLTRIKYKKIVYCVDTWSSVIDLWKEELSAGGIECVFCSNKNSVHTFEIAGFKTFYVPYSMNEKYFYPRECKKTHLFMQMGRKNKTLHEYVLKYLQLHHINDDDYIREKQRGEVVFPDFNQLAEEINKTWFFIVSPRDVDEEEITGNISDVTARFSHKKIQCLKYQVIVSLNIL
ncbi:MAG: hypothetical protein ACYDEX_22550 [Mobilitalea sp.]